MNSKSSITIVRALTGADCINDVDLMGVTGSEMGEVGDSRGNMAEIR